MIEKIKIARDFVQTVLEVLNEVVEANQAPCNPPQVSDDTPAFTATYETKTPLNFVPTEATNPKIIVTEEEVKPVKSLRDILIHIATNYGKAEALSILTLCGAKKVSEVRDEALFRQLAEGYK